MNKTSRVWKDDLLMNIGFTFRIWDEVGRQAKTTDYQKFKGMAPDEIYDELLAQVSPLDAINKAVTAE